MTIILDGKKLAKQIEDELQERVSNLKSKLNFTPKLATILVGDDPSSAVYVQMKRNACKRAGIDSKLIKLKESTTTKELKLEIEKLNSDPEVFGILLQHPVPSQINERACFDTITGSKDVDGVTSSGFGALAMGEKIYGSATPKGIMYLLEHFKINLEGKKALVIGRSPILGKPLSMMLLNKNATVTIAHSRTNNLKQEVKNSDIILACLGKPEFIKAEWIKDDAILVDAGFHKTTSKTCGDIELTENLIKRISAYTPVPGGVGPMTISTLIRQTVESVEKSAK